MIKVLIGASLAHLLLTTTLYLVGEPSYWDWVLSWMGLAFIAMLPVFNLFSISRKAPASYRPGLAVFFAANLLFIIGEPVVFGVLQLPFPGVSSLGNPSDSDALLAALSLSVAFAAFLIGYLVAAKKRHNRSRSRIPSSDSLNHRIGSSPTELLAVALFITGFIGLLSLVGSTGLTYVSFGAFLTEGRRSGVLGAADGAVGMSSPVGMLLFSALIPAAILSLHSSFSTIDERSRFSKFLFLVIAGAASLILISTGGRTSLILVMGSFLLLVTHEMLTLGDAKLFQAARWRLVCLYSFFGFLLLAVTAAQVTFRASGWSDIGSEALSSVNLWDSMSGYSLNRELALIMQYRLEAIGVNSWLEQLFAPIPATLFDLFSAFIPRTFWVDKPIDPTWTYYNLFRTGNDALLGTSNVTPTFVGRLYMRYGFEGIAEISFLLGFATCVFERRFLAYVKTDAGMACVYALLLMFIFQSVRDLQFGRLYPVAMLAGAVVLLRFLRRPRHSLRYRRLPL